MRVSMLAYASFGIAAIMVLVAYALNPDIGFLLTVVPMLAILAAVPLLLNVMNRRQAEKVDMKAIKKYRVMDLTRLSSGSEVRIRGVVEKVSFKWLNRPYFLVNDQTGTVGVIMFAAPREDINPGDSIEVVGSLRSFGLSKGNKIWGIKMKRLSN
ncbi:MAG: nucleotide-binding protein [Clostridia bacterium]|nr:nucleotide-binding protein [Clostridia bacterium]